MRHACDADHVVTVSTIVARHRSISGAALVGAVWGVGHTITILVVGIAITAFSVVIPARLGLSIGDGRWCAAHGPGRDESVGTDASHLSSFWHRASQQYGLGRWSASYPRASPRRATPFAPAHSSIERSSRPSWARHVPDGSRFGRRNRAWSVGFRSSCPTCYEHEPQSFLVRDLSRRIRAWDYRRNDGDQHRDGGSRCRFGDPIYNT
jgi:hypothetical protein